MLRATLLGLAVLAFGLSTIATAAAETVSDPEHNFRVTVPGGWVAMKNPTEDVRVAMTPPDREQTAAYCNVVTEPHPPSKEMSPAQIESELDNELTDASWLAMFQTVILFEKVAIEKTGSASTNGHKAHYVIATFNVVSPGSPVRKVKLEQHLVAIPGELFFVTCAAGQESFAQQAGAFKTVFDTFAPLSDIVAAAEPNGVPSLTLYAGANFGGVSRVVMQDTPDLAAFGWHDAAASVRVAGGGLWQTCSGANYTGSCRIVANALHESLTVGSARHLSPAQNGFALMLQAGGAQGVGMAVRRH